MKRWWWFVLGIVLLVMPTTHVQGQSEGFLGDWRSVDFDGSFMTLTIETRLNAPGYWVHLVDYGASVCGLDEDGHPLYPGIFDTTAYTKGSDPYLLTIAEADVWCVPDEAPRYYWGTIPTSTTRYDPVTDTLENADGSRWSRFVPNRTTPKPLPPPPPPIRASK